MKNKLVWISVTILILFALALKLFVKEEAIVDKPLNINVGDEFTIFETENKKYVLNYKIGDVTGDDINDMVILIGEKEQIQDNFASNIDMVLYDSSRNQYLKIELKNFSGGNSQIELANFTTEKGMETFLSCENAGEHNVRIVAYTTNGLKEIFRDKNNKGLYFTVELLDGFKAKIVNKKLNVNNIIDIQNNKEECIKLKLFEESGKLIEKNERPKNTGFVNVELVQLSDCMGIRTKQRIIIKDKLNIIEEITVLWKYQDGKWQIKEATGVRQGNLLY